jgi:hypothetical protein
MNARLSPTQTRLVEALRAGAVIEYSTRYIRGRWTTLYALIQDGETQRIRRDTYLAVYDHLHGATEFWFDEPHQRIALTAEALWGEPTWQAAQEAWERSLEAEDELDALYWQMRNAE